jgi:hypothetical protein
MEPQKPAAFMTLVWCSSLFLDREPLNWENLSNHGFRRRCGRISDFSSAELKG